MSIKSTSAYAMLGMLFVTAAASVYGATFPEDKTNLPHKVAIDFIVSYCRLVPDGNEDITADLIDTGKISKFYTGYTCDEAQRIKEELFEPLEDLATQYKLMPDTK